MKLREIAPEEVNEPLNLVELFLYIHKNRHRGSFMSFLGLICAADQAGEKAKDLTITRDLFHFLAARAEEYICQEEKTKKKITH